MSALIVAVAEDSPAARAGVREGDELVTVNGAVLRDVIEYHLETERPEVELVVQRDGGRHALTVRKTGGEPMGIEVASAVFDRVRTCDNHCEFCFIHQLPKGMRRSLYLKDDDYRLSFLYGNYTTLTRFTEADLERVVTERLSPLYVSIHATDPTVRAEILRNPRGAMSLRWLRALLDHGIEVHGQVVCCPGVNDGPVLEDTLCGILDEYPDLADVAIVPLGVSDHHRQPRMRAHSLAEAEAVLEAVHRWQEVFMDLIGRRMVFAADEYYLMAGRPFPPLDHYDDVDLHEDGVGMARTFEREFIDRPAEVAGTRAGFFAWVDGAPAEGYRAPRTAAPAGVAVGVRLGRRVRAGAPVGVLTAPLGAAVLAPLLERLGRPDVRVVVVENRYFGGTIGVTGLMVGQDIARVLADEPPDHRYLLPDVCLSNGRFLDGTRPEDLPRPVEVVATDGASLRAALEAGR